MADELASDRELFFRMARKFPVRTCIFTFSLPAFALVQVLNGVVHDGSLLFIAVFSAVALACSVLLTQYQVTVYRRRQLADRWE